MNTDSAQQIHFASSDGISTVAVLTSVLWLGCLFVGALGFVMPYSWPQPTPPPAPVVMAQLTKVELTTPPTPTPGIVQTRPPQPMQPPPLAAPAIVPPAPQLLAVAQPSPVVASVLPIEAPTRIVEVNQAAFFHPAPQPAPVAPGIASTTGTRQPGAGIAAAPPVQTLTFGEGEGTQPAPSYPETARRAGQEGTVVIRFSVGTDGRVLAAEPSAPSPWGTLNREALRVVREQWRFKPGPVRLCEVAIRFELKK